MSPVRVDRTEKPHISRGMGTTAQIAVPGVPGPPGPAGSDADTAGYVNDPASQTRAAVDSLVTTEVTNERTRVATLANKNIALGSNNVSGTLAEFNAALTGADFATQAGAEALTNKTLDTTNTINGFTASRFMEADGTGKLVSGAKAIPAGAVVGTTDTQTLTNKTVTHPTTGKNLGSGCWGSCARTSNQAVATGTWTAITFDTSNLVNGFTLVGAGRLTVPVAGLYLVTGQIQWTSNATGFRTVAVLRNSAGAFSTAAIVTRTYCPAVSGTTTNLNASHIVSLAAGDYIELWGHQNSGGSLTAGADADANQVTLAATLISAST